MEKSELNKVTRKGQNELDEIIYIMKVVVSQSITHLLSVLFLQSSLPSVTDGPVTVPKAQDIGTRGYQNQVTINNKKGLCFC